MPCEELQLLAIVDECIPGVRSALQDYQQASKDFGAASPEAIKADADYRAQRALAMRGVVAMSDAGGTCDEIHRVMCF